MSDRLVRPMTPEEEMLLRRRVNSTARYEVFGRNQMASVLTSLDEARAAGVTITQPDTAPRWCPSCFRAESVRVCEHCGTRWDDSAALRSTPAAPKEDDRA